MRFLEVGFHEPHKGAKQSVSKAEGTTVAESSLVRPSWVRPVSNQPPGYRYSWKETEKTLKQLGEKPGDPYEGILLEYVNPLTGGPTLPTLSCGIQMLRPNEKTRAHRHTSSTVYHVFRGKALRLSTISAMNGNVATRSPFPFGASTIMKICLLNRPFSL